MGKPAEKDELNRREQSVPQLPNEPMRRFAGRSVDVKADQTLSVEACPLTEAEGNPMGDIGPYNAVSLAGRALSLSASLSPDYCQAYLAGLEDLISLRALPDGKRKKRR